MDELRIPLTSIPDAGLQVSVEFDTEDVRPEGAESLPMPRAHLQGHLTLMGEDVLFRGAVTGDMEHPCDRCLEPISLPFEQECVWFFGPDTGADPMLEEPDARQLDGDTVDLGRYVWEELALAMPSRFVCPDSEPCPRRQEFESRTDTDGQEEPAVNNAFAQLKDLFPDLDGNADKE